MPPDLLRISNFSLLMSSAIRVTIHSVGPQYVCTDYGLICSLLPVTQRRHTAPIECHCLQGERSPGPHCSDRPVTRDIDTRAVGGQHLHQVGCQRIQPDIHPSANHVYPPITCQALVCPPSHSQLSVPDSIILKKDSDMKHHLSLSSRESA